LSGQSPPEKPRWEQIDYVYPYFALETLALTTLDDFAQDVAESVSEEDCIICYESLRRGERKLAALKVCESQLSY
jgi:hypothetical protein